MILLKNLNEANRSLPPVLIRETKPNWLLPDWYKLKILRRQASLVVPWSSVHLPMQWTEVQSLVWEDPTSLWATKPVCPRACALQQEKPLQWETCTPQLEKTPARQWRRRAAKNSKVACWYRCGSDQMLLGNHPQDHLGCVEYTKVTTFKHYMKQHYNVSCIWYLS